MRESWVRVYTEASGASQGGPDREQTGGPARSSFGSPDATSPFGLPIGERPDRLRARRFFLKRWTSGPGFSSQNPYHRRYRNIIERCDVIE